MRFSQRHGAKPIKDILQVDSMDEDLRNSLWNVLTVFYWDREPEYRGDSPTGVMEVFLRRLWHDHFKELIDSIPHSWTEIHMTLKMRFFDFVYYEVYDFIEFIANEYLYTNDEKQDFRNACNEILEREVSAYRFVGDRITPITSDMEIEAIEKGLADTNGLKSVNTHLKTALAFFADRESPDYRNSIKESISAVESLCRLIAGRPGASLGAALKKIERTGIVLHPALKGAFTKLYGYTSDENGIRHALIDESRLESEDAKFMLIACSGFTSYLTEKASRAGISLILPSSPQ